MTLEWWGWYDTQDSSLDYLDDFTVRLFEFDGGAPKPNPAITFKPGFMGDMVEDAVRGPGGGYLGNSPLVPYWRTIDSDFGGGSVQAHRYVADLSSSPIDLAAGTEYLLSIVNDATDVFGLNLDFRNLATAEAAAEAINAALNGLSQPARLDTTGSTEWTDSLGTIASHSFNIPWFSEAGSGDTIAVQSSGPLLLLPDCPDEWCVTLGGNVIDGGETAGWADFTLLHRVSVPEPEPSQNRTSGFPNIRLLVRSFRKPPRFDRG